MVQAYYTQSKLASAVMTRAIDAMNSHLVKNVLDVCAGSGRLGAAYRKAARAEHSSIQSLTFIEPETEPIVKLESQLQSTRDRIFNMTAEEFNLTYAEPGSYDLVVCNPPFGERCGETALDELISDLHFPNVARFESYFLLTAAVLSQHYLIFLLPNSYARHEEARSTFQSMEAMGWDLLDLRELPLDGYDNALVSTSMLVFAKTPPTVAWTETAIELMLNPTYTLLPDPERVTRQGQHGPIEGYLWEESFTRYSFCPRVRILGTDEPVTETDFLWSPKLRPIGSTWERSGCLYELTANGWEPSNFNGYIQGFPVSLDFITAHAAFDLYRQGAVETARHVAADLDLPALRKEYGAMALGSFLNLLEQGPKDTSALGRDLKRLGMIHLEESFVPMPVHAQRCGPWIIDQSSLTFAQKCRLYLTLDVMPQWLTLDVERGLRTRAIPFPQLELRSPWIPRAMIAEYLDLELDPHGLYAFGDDSTSATDALIPYLNFGKGGQRIAEGDAEACATRSHEFAVCMNDWSDPNHQALRLRLHAQYVYTQAPRRSTVSGTRSVPCAKPLHRWQTEDLPFLLNGESICNWDVGLGKTAGAMTAAVSHPGITLITVPKPVLGKWLNEFERFYPQTRVDVLGFRRNKANKWVLHSAGLVDQAKTLFFSPDTEVILTTHQVFSRLQISKQEQLKADREDAYDQLGSTDTERAKTARSLFVKHAAARNFLFGGELTFSDLPLAHLLLIVDEGHQFKSLHPMPSSGWGNQLVMAGSCGRSKRARDMKIKADLLRQAGGKTLCLTATPVTNSVAEAFNMLRIWAPSVLQQRGIHNTQQFIDTFCELDAITAVSPTGKIVSGQTIVGFRNLDTLRSMWESCMVTRTAEDVGLPIPSKSEQTLEIEPTAPMRAWMNQQKQLLSESLKENGQHAHIFEIISALDTIASFPPSVGIASNPKGDVLTKQVLHFYRSTDGGQIIFSDRIASHDGIHDALVAAGIDPAHLVIINAQTAPGVDQRMAIQDAYNAGTYRVVIAGAVAGEGIDLQKNTVAMHFNNLTWDSLSIHQRIGRGVRQGNDMDRVHVYYYLLKGSTDIYRFATSSNKKHWWDDLRACQTDTTPGGIFTNPVSDELIASIALDPEEALASLRAHRLEREIHDQFKRFRELFKTMLRFTDPLRRDVSIPVLQNYEASLRKLVHIPASIIDEGIQRALMVTALRDRARAGRDVEWAEWVTELKTHAKSENTAYFLLWRLFELAIDDAANVSFKDPVTELLRGSPEWASMPTTFGKPLPAKITARQAESEPALLLDTVAAATPGVWEALPIQVPVYDPSAWTQPSLFELA